MYCLERTFEKNPDQVCRFVQASLEGWRYAFDHPDEALDIVMKTIRAANPGSNRVHQRWMLQKMNELIRPSGSATNWGELSPKDYEQVGQTMVRQGIISSLPPLEAFQRDCIGHGK